jgi:subtilisin family serine protease
MRIAVRHLPRLLATLGLVLILRPSMAQAGRPIGVGPHSVADELLVGMRPGVSKGRAQALYQASGAALLDEIAEIRVHRIRVPGPARAAVAAALSRRHEVAFVEENHLFEADATPNDPWYGGQWHLGAIAAPSAWDLESNAWDVVIAILDTGVDPSHPDLAGKLIPGFNFFDGNTDTSDPHGHGTMVAGSAAAIGDNGIGVASVAWGSPIMPLRVASPSGWATASSIGEAIIYAVDNGARVMNVSFGGVAASATITAAAEYATEHGGMVIAAAGNSGGVESIAPNPFVLSVSATDQTDALATFSSRGNYVDVAAPGVSILTTGRGGTYGPASGTSFSGAIVAGVAALILSVNPDLTASDVEAILAATADDLGSSGYDTSFGHGRVNAYQALLQVSGSPVPPGDTVPPTAQILSPTGGAQVSASVSVSVSAVDDVAVDRVDLYLDGARVATDSAAPFTFSWDTFASSDGEHGLEAVASDSSGNTGSSGVVSVMVDNAPADVNPPTVSIVSPWDGASVSKALRILTSAQDDERVARVEVRVDGVLIGSRSCDASSCSSRFHWKSRRATLGLHEISALAFDAAGNVSAADTIAVNKTR